MALLAEELQALQPIVQRSPLPGFEYVKGFGIFGLPFDSGHVLALRVFPENDFAPYVTVWHRSPAGDWSIIVDGPRVDTACPRYYGSAARHVLSSRIALAWTGPAALSIEVDRPRLEWNVTMGAPLLYRVMNAVSARVPERLWRSPAVLRVFQWMAGRLFGLGRVTLFGPAPNGQYAMLMPKRMFPIVSATARLDGQDLGQPATTRSRDNPAIGAVRLPARGVFAVGQAFFKIRDPVEYDRTRAELARAPERLR